MSELNTIEEAIADIKQGKTITVVAGYPYPATFQVRGEGSS